MSTDNLVWQIHSGMVCFKLRYKNSDLSWVDKLNVNMITIHLPIAILPGVWVANNYIFIKFQSH